MEGNIKRHKKDAKNKKSTKKSPTGKTDGHKFYCLRGVFALYLAKSIF